MFRRFILASNSLFDWPTKKGWNTMDVNAALKKILGPEYGGPSLSYEDGYFFIYDWGDAPAGTETLGAGVTVEDAIRDYLSSQSGRNILV